jgi:hypothetical protein
LQWLLLTSTVRPHVGVNVTVADETVRRTQYVRALSRWANAWPAPSRMVLVENSGADLKRLVDDALPRGAVQPILVKAPEPAGTRQGKGAAEARMIDYAVSVLDDLEEEDMLFKVTGRLFVRNVRRIVPTSRGRGQIILRGAFDWSYIDTRFIGASGDIWRGAFQGMGDDVDEARAIFLEHVAAARSLDALRSGTAAVKRFSGRPAFEGLSGTSSSMYGGWRSRMRQVVFTPMEIAMRRIPHDKQF